jgi:broad specificity phosphatase PhoE
LVAGGAVVKRTDYESWTDYYGGRSARDQHGRVIDPFYDTSRPAPHPIDDGRPDVLDLDVDFDNAVPIAHPSVPPQDDSPVDIVPYPHRPPGGPHLPPSYDRSKTVDLKRSVYIVRHGECDDDIPPHRHSGWRAVGLNETGIETGEKLRDYFANDRPLTIYSSPLRRAIETASIIADADNLVTVIPERDLGPWLIGPEIEGRLESETERELRRLQRFSNLRPNGPADAVESWNEFIQRTVRAFEWLLTDAPVEHVTVLVTHSWCCLIQLNYLAAQYGLRVAATGTRAHPGAIFCVDVNANGTPTALETGDEDDEHEEVLEIL